MRHLFHDDQHRLLEALQAVAEESQVPLYLVGGIVRDLFLGLALHDKDIDVVVDGDGYDFAERAAADIGATLKRFPAFLTAKLVSPSRFPAIDEVDIAHPRTEKYQAPGALPQVTRAALSEDLRRRDFSINAVALPLAELQRWLESGSALAELAVRAVDPFAGLADLRRRALRVLHDRSFIDDPTRLYRGCRYLARLGGAFDARTDELARAAVAGGALGAVSGFRLFREVRYAFDETASALPVLQAMARYQLLVGPIFESVSQQDEFLEAAAAALAKGATGESLLPILFERARGGDVARAERLFLGFGFSKKEIGALRAQLGR